MSDPHSAKPADAAPTRRSFRPGTAASLFTLFGLCLLIGLGLWQVQRLEWKESLIADLQARGEIEALTSLPAGSLDGDALSYRRVILTGRYVEGVEFFLPGRSYQGMTGEELAAPFVTEQGRGIIVSRGWLPRHRKDPATREGDGSSGTIQIEGILRPGGWSGSESFKPVNDPEKNRWVYYDLELMAEAAELEDPVTALYVSLTGREGPQDRVPVPLPPAVTLSNNHLEYALTWFALAFGLLAIYLVFGFARGRERSGADKED